MSPWITYSLVRLGLFALVFGGLFWLGVTWWVALIFATLLSFTVSYIFLAKAREYMASSLETSVGSKKKARDLDAEAEDAC